MKHIHNPVSKIFLNMRITCSAESRLYTFKGKSWHFTSVPLDSFLILLQHWLSRVCMLGASPYPLNIVKTSFHAWVIFYVFLPFMGIV